MTGGGAPGAGSGAVAGAVAGPLPGSGSGAAPGAMSAALSGAVPGSVPGVVPGAVHGSGDAAAAEGVEAVEPVRRLAEIEDATNLWVVHPVSNRLTPLLAAAGVHPNAVSLAGMACGAAAGVAYHGWRDPWLVVAGFALMLAWHVLDGVDGQLARLTRTQSATGKVLDGVCDYVTFAAVYLGLASALAGERGAWVWGLVVLAGGCHAVQAALYETQRQDYLFWGWGRRSAETAAPAEDPAGRGVARFAGRLHRGYARVQALGGGVSAGDRRRLAAALDARGGGAAAVRRLYRATFAAPLRRWSVLSANYRTVALFGFALAGVPLWYFVWEIAGLGGVLGVLLVRQGGRYRGFFARLDDAKGG